jgi:hypothetical protein
MKHRDKLAHEGNRRMKHALENWSVSLNKKKRIAAGTDHVAKISPNSMRGEVSSFDRKNPA